MEYKKPPLSFEDQADRLLKRGMIGERDLIIDRLQSVNYYRLSGYWFPFRQNDDSFKKGLTFNTVWDRYVFDRRLRILVMDAIERIEVFVRTHIAYCHALKHGAFGYIESPETLPNLKQYDKAGFLKRLIDEQCRSKEQFTQHFYTNYGDKHNFLPIWMATEVMTFNTMLTFYKGVSDDIKKEVAEKLGITDKILESWLLSLNTVRNICAHHGRLWNRIIGNPPVIPKSRKRPHCQFPDEIKNNRIFMTLTICQYCLSIIAPQSRWAFRLDDLLKKHPAIPLKSMGFLGGWKEIEIWQTVFAKSCHPTFEEVKQKVNSAIRALYKHDHDLISNNANERSISHKLAEHLQKEFSEWHVDCEYNRKMGDIKKLNVSFDKLKPDDLEAKTVYPDIIVHHRNTEHNLLVIEMKKNGDTFIDEEKLKSFTGKDYKYKWGLLLQIKTGNDFELNWFSDGEVINVRKVAK